LITVEKFINQLKRNDLRFCTGVPDSLFKDLCFEMKKKFKSKHLVAANEGSAVAIGIGYHLKTKKIPIIYMQNSGLGNAINPIISLADSKVYNIPLFFLIGWRGEKSSNFKDEPQHISQGNETENFLKNLKIKYKIINSKSDTSTIIKNLKIYSKKNNKPVCILIKKNTFKKGSYKINDKRKYLSREKILNLIFEKLPSNSTIVSTTGILSRELYEINKTSKNKLNNLMCVGGMGHAISVATGISKNTKKKVLCFDGDGAITMHMGSLTTSSQQNNIIHLVFNNHGHESVGGHETSSKHIKFNELAKTIGYQNTKRCSSSGEIIKTINSALNSKKSYFIEILCKQGHRSDISRPKEKMRILKEKFMKKLK
jgi:phosphonopyruvate decarboxylase